MRLVLCVGLGLFTGCAGMRRAANEAEAYASPDTTAAEQKADQELSEADREALTTLHAIDGYQIELGRLAMDRGAPAVRKYAGALVNDYEGIDRKLVALANERNVSIGGPIPDDMQMKLDRFEGLTGTAFDQAFQQEMIEGHQAAIQQVADQLTTVTNAEVAGLLTGVLPTLQKRLEAARALELRGS